MRSRPVRRIGLTILLAALAVPPALAGRGPAKGEKYALLVGVRKYDPTELHALPFAERDATDLARVLRANGYREENDVVMTQAAAAEDLRFLPTADRIRKELALLTADCTEE